MATQKPMYLLFQWIDCCVFIFKYNSSSPQYKKCDHSLTNRIRNESYRRVHKIGTQLVAWLPKNVLSVWPVMACTFGGAKVSCDEYCPNHLAHRIIRCSPTNQTHRAHLSFLACCEEQDVLHIRERGINVHRYVYVYISIHIYNHSPVSIIIIINRDSQPPYVASRFEILSIHTPTDLNSN